MRLLLASASPRRAELLRAAGFAFEVRPSRIDESLRPGETAVEYVRRLAEQKAAAAMPSAPDQVVLAADTVVVVDRLIWGKPSDDAEATGMLRRLSGRQHQVLTGVALVTPAAQGRVEKVSSIVEMTEVEFALLSEAEIRWYVASGEPRDKAGAYAIQGLASRFVSRIEGSYSNVVGLPVETVCAMLKEHGWVIDRVPGRDYPEGGSRTESLCL